jgi:hypothetical protein
MVTICTRLRDEPRVRAIAEAHDGVFYAAGTHPMNAAAASPWRRSRTSPAIARHPKMVGIGESGLDYHYTAETRTAQEESLRIHVEAARRTGLPLIIHARDADADIARILERGARRRLLRLRDALLHRLGRALAEGRARARLLPLGLGHRDLPRARPISARSSRRRRSTGCWSRPTARTSRPSPIAVAQRAGLHRRHRPDQSPSISATMPDELRSGDDGEFRPPLRQGRRRRRRPDGAAAGDHPRLRLVGRRAAARRCNGAAATRATRGTPGVAARCCSSASTATAPRAS